SWAALISAGALPLDRVHPVTTMAIDRLQDKTVMVRRNAMQLLTMCLEMNPFGSTLDPAPYEAKMKELVKWHEENEQESGKAAREVARLQKEAEEAEEKGEEGEEETERRNKELETAIAKVERAEEEEQEDTSENDRLRSLRAAKMNALTFAAAALQFISCLEGANVALSSMLMSKSTSDVVEALRFYVRAKQFQLPCAITGMRSALSLMWSSEKQVQSAVLKAFVDVFVGQQGTDGKKLLEDKAIAHNLIVLVGESTISEQVSIEEAISHLVRDEVIPNEVFLILWSVSAKATGPARSAAMLNIAFGAAADPSLVDSTSRLRHLLEAGFGEYVEKAQDWKTARAAAIALQKIGRLQERVEEGSAKDIIIDNLIDACKAVVRGDWINKEDNKSTNSWFAAAEACMDAIFSISSAPDVHAASIIKAMAACTFGSATATPTQLSRFFFAAGHLALKLLLYTESITKELKKGNSSRTAELGVAQEQEALTEKTMDDIAEKEIVGRGLLGVFGPLIVRVVANESGAYTHDLLQACATMALAKFMSISNSFCEKQLPLLLTSLSKNNSADTTLRANLVIALGDLAFRFPNTFEPYTAHLYSNLTDPSPTVKRHSMSVLSHLILNDMIKIKGNVASVAMLIVSPDQTLSDMSKLLFNELSKRSNNPVYNLIPDVVSLLSTDPAVSRPDFKAIMSFLLSFMTKDKLSDALVDKLMKRFETAASINVKRDLALCLSLLKATEKSVKTLNDGFKLYKDCLFDSEIFGHFASILKKGKSF
ncbi:hypothetical protein TrRE_jg2257, partial [Triparma retinervis]